MRIAFLAFFLLPSCQGRHCELASDEPVADDEITEVGTADDVLAAVVTSQTLAGTWWDGRPVEVSVDVARGSGDARYQEYEVRGGGLKQEMSILVCPTGLSVPLQVAVRSADEALSLDVAVDQQVVEHLDRGWVEVTPSQAWATALTPDGPADPGPLTDKEVWATLVYTGDPAELVYVEAGYRGEEDLEETKHDAQRSYVVLQAGDDPRGKPPVTSSPE